MAKINAVHGRISSRASQEPLHSLVRAALRERMITGEYPPGESLPSVQMLATEFDVSAITVKRAIRDLQLAGLVQSHAGLGTFVREHRRFVQEVSASMALRGIKEAARDSHQTVSLQLVSITEGEIQDKNLQHFAYKEGRYFCVKKSISIDGMVAMFDTSYISKNVPDGFLDDAGTKFLYEIANEHGFDLREHRVLIDACLAEPEVQMHFAVPESFPILRRSYHFSAGPIDVYGTVLSPLDRVAYYIDLRADHLAPA
ncbi:GntR family transcriptional regulator [Mesorhizobium sp. L-2-11]|uniref:GntR family transcriptional regulator n=1 Tax=Mesorhizobium sp. L-2-11 TaxID=2744521 RepID=UPI001925D756|nr:GntR family transcriptional regulator [Mesorhizobium sp. L-2-11]BCH19833.1 hypothetical protein MesoLjLa_66840 [Mesorhizobium sp. L-2-11]